MILSSGSVAPPEVELHDSAAGQANGGAKVGVGDFPPTRWTQHPLRRTGSAEAVCYAELCSEG
jgi:hypothetical protein